MPHYTRLDSITDLDPLFERSRQAPVVIFKHSLICPVSSGALREYESFLSQRPDADDGVYALIEIQNARSVSNAVAERTGVRHQSPQALVLRDGEVAWHASHGSIRAHALEEALES